MTSTDVVSWLEEFYSSYCDGDWEHEWGIEISTLDNPGWSVSIDLTGTALENVPFNELKIERNEAEWAHCWVRDSSWQGRGGARNLKELLETFRRWAGSQGPQ